MRKRPLLGILALVVAIAISSSQLWAGSKVIVGEQVPADRQVSIDHIDHGAWDELLRKYCDDQGYVAYQAWLAAPGDVQRLDAYLAQLSHADPNRAATKESKLAYWTNAYNALTIKGIMRDYPVKSIKDLQSLAFGYKIWDDLLLRVGDKQVSLNNMEHDILRKMGEPRIHFGLVCASISCPPLLNHAYTTASVDEQLTANGKKFFANPQNFQVEGNAIKLSQLLKWYGSDFGADQAAQLAALAPYLPSERAQGLATSGSANVSYLPYDWNLNDQASRTASSKRQ